MKKILEVLKSADSKINELCINSTINYLVAYRRVHPSKINILNAYLDEFYEEVNSGDVDVKVLRNLQDKVIEILNEDMDNNV